MEKSHMIALSQLMTCLEPKEILSVLDAGSGRSSLGFIFSNFKNASIDAVVYPGDFRKINSIKKNFGEKGKSKLIELDICKNRINKKYDLIVAHLLIGEATKFNNTSEDLIDKLLSLDFKYLMLVDYLEDDTINFNTLEGYLNTDKYKVIKKVLVENEDPQNFQFFRGEHNVGYLIEKTI